MDFRQIQYFIEVAKREHVTEAAHALHVAQSAVSRQIYNLEQELGTDLFIREGRSVRLTPIGRRFLLHAKEAIKVIESGKREVEEYLDPERGIVRIGFPSSLAAYTLPTVISAFREEHPQVKFQLHQALYHRLIEMVIKGEIDMALIAPLPKHEKKVKGDILFMERIVALLPASHPLAKRSSIKLSELKDDSFVLFPEGFILREMVVEAFRELGVAPHVSFEGEDIDAIKGLVSAGLGVTLIPEITLVDSLPRSTVKLIISEPKVERNVGVIIPSDRQLLPTEQLFYQFLKKFFSRIGGFGTSF